MASLKQECEPDGDNISQPRVVNWPCVRWMRWSFLSFLLLTIACTSLAPAFGPILLWG